MGKLSWHWTDFGDVWYVAEHARTGRSSCKECKQAVAKDALRIGIEKEDDDHSGSSLGWYHPPCLFRSMNRATNANKRIAKPSDISNFDDLLEEDKATITALIAGRGQAAGADAGAPVPAKVAGSAQLKVNDISGEVGIHSRGTFALKDVIKAAGGRWAAVEKCWTMPSEASAAALFGIDVEAVVDGSTHQLQLIADVAIRAGSAGAPGAEAQSSKKRGRDDEAPTDEAPGADGKASTRFPVPVESVCSLEECDARTLEALCKARGVAHSGTKAARIARIEADMVATPCPDNAAYRKQVYSLISTGRVQAKGRGAADLPWDYAGEKRD